MPLDTVAVYAKPLIKTPEICNRFIPIESKELVRAKIIIPSTFYCCHPEKIDVDIDYTPGLISELINRDKERYLYQEFHIDKTFTCRYHFELKI